VNDATLRDEGIAFYRLLLLQRAARGPRCWNSHGIEISALVPDISHSTARNIRRSHRVTSSVQFPARRPALARCQILVRYQVAMSRGQRTRHVTVVPTLRSGSRNHPAQFMCSPEDFRPERAIASWRHGFAIALLGRGRRPTMQNIRHSSIPEKRNVTLRQSKYCDFR